MTNDPRFLFALVTCVRLDLHNMLICLYSLACGDVIGALSIYACLAFG